MKFLYQFLILFQFYLIQNTIFCDAESLCTDFNPCKNMADCFKWDDDPTRVKCVCKRGFNGNLCEIWPKICSTDFCFNGGTCVLIKRIPRCLCQPDYNGLFCENFSFPNNENIAPIESVTNSSRDQGSFLEPEKTKLEISIPIEVTSTQTSHIPFTTTDSSNVNLESNLNNQNLFQFFQKFENNPPVASTSALPVITSDPTFPYESSQNPDPYIPVDVRVKNSICDFEPCLNFGNCIPINNANSLFKFRCVCPENYGGILCENIIPKSQLLNQEREPLYYSPTSFWLNQVTSSSTEMTTPTQTTTIPTIYSETTTSETPTTSTTERVQQFSSNVYQVTEKKIRKYSLCSQLRPCANNGQCVDNDINSEGVQKFKCICKSEYTGIFCHIKVTRRGGNNACAYNLCLNSGECIPNKDNNSFTCVCPPNYTGKFCEINSY